MESFFRYNWIVREQWFQWCEDVPLEELLRPRTGGVGNILQTFFHIIDVEWSWLQVLQGKPDGMENFDNYKTLEAVRQFDRKLRPDVEAFVLSWDPSMEKRPYIDPELDSSIAKESWGEVMRHVIAHEIHHMGQLSVWSRELDKKPVSANFIGKGLIPLDN
ncbi:DinB family protein [Paenibacillus marchantiae]|uniref:DinB family protein n=1 Tax=Paenibacillus marchantiae TaxID=3026433 RepID=UPI00237C2C97|nr:DinB family protein [Paenibacillus marchantiae]WDQ32462.1 DinB family protein [Paenibacillus marchantiae]